MYTPLTYIETILEILGLFYLHQWHIAKGRWRVKGGGGGQTKTVLVKITKA